MSRMFCFCTLLSCLNHEAAFALEDLYPCNLELNAPLSSSTNGGSFYARVLVEDRLADASSPLKLRWMTATAPKTGVWTALFLSTEEFQYKIQSVELPQSLENLGVSYRMGFCYLGPESTATSTPSDDSSQGSYDLVGTICTGTGGNGIPYTGKLNGTCDLRGVGANQNPRTSSEVSPTIIDADIQFSLTFGRLSTGEISFDQAINSAIAEAPRYCKLNIEMTEDASGARPFEINLNPAHFTLQIDKNLR